MPETSPTRHLLPAVIALTAPTAGVLIVLVALDALSFPAAMLSMAAVALLTGLLIRPYLADLTAVAAYVRDLTMGPAEPPTLLRGGPIDDLTGAIGQLRRAWLVRKEELQDMAAGNETVLDSLPDPLFLLGQQRRVIRANLAARKLFGRELAGRDMAAVLRDPDLLETAEAVLAGQPGRTIDFVLPGPTEQTFRARVEPLPSRTPDGAVAMLALHDLTAIKRMEQMRADFVANASHELRTPLASLLGFTETLRGPAKDDSEARERFLGIMHEQGSRMARLVEDLLSLSRIELNEHTMPVDTVDLAAVVRSVIEPLELQAGKRGITIAADLPDPLPAVTGQADELAQVFQNLLDNAIKYGRENSTVTVSARIADRPTVQGGERLARRAVAVSVRDQGEGIAPEHLPRLTERFFRVDTARSRKMGGTGLGLAIVKHVVNRHRGLLTIDSTLGEGSTFTVWLPVAEAESAQPDRLTARG